ncbi:MAG: hypothetical protein EP307_01665 [Rhodobacteraceae bacterium]|nr:MAG: hypothetical protein EP307_01665 [Paracoccaceae bacterium]
MEDDDVARAFIMALMLALGLGLAAPAHAQSVSDIELGSGDVGKMVSARITGAGYHDFRLAARSGQNLFVSLMAGVTDGEGSVHFDILPPGSDGVAIYNSSSRGNDTQIDLPADGVYTIRVYLTGNDRDTGKTVSFNMDLSIQ